MQVTTVHAKGWVRPSQKSLCEKRTQQAPMQPRSLFSEQKSGQINTYAEAFTSEVFM
jgi:hypothetical protein